MTGLSAQFDQYFVIEALSAENARGLQSILNPESTTTESDPFDRRTICNVVRQRSSGALIAAVRLILSDANRSDEPFPLEAFPVLRRRARDHVWRVPREQLGQISRFAVASDFRRRADETVTTHGLTASLLAAPDISGKRGFPLVLYGLFKAVVTMSTQQGVAYWYSMLDPTLVRLLARFGIRFQPIGPVVDYRNARQPCIAAADIVLSEIKFRRPELWSFVTDDGLTLPVIRH